MFLIHLFCSSGTIQTERSGKVVIVGAGVLGIALLGKLSALDSFSGDTTNKTRIHGDLTNRKYHLSFVKLRNMLEGWKNIEKQPTVTLIKHQNQSEENMVTHALDCNWQEKRRDLFLFYASKLWQARVWVQINWHFETIHTTHVTTPRRFFKENKTWWTLEVWKIALGL